MITQGLAKTSALYNQRKRERELRMRGKSENPAARNFTSLSNHLQTSKDSLYYFSFDFQNYTRKACVSICMNTEENFRDFVENMKLKLK